MISPRRASLLVVLTAHVVDRVMKPERQRDFVRMFGELTTLGEPGEALVEML
jgi:hypothetical protein